jgi:cytochrome P450
MMSDPAGMWRIAKRDTVLAGVEIPAGSLIMLRMDSANRDARQFPNPTKLDIDRPNRNQHLAFGSGIHYCLGNFVSRQELAVGFRRLLERIEDPEIIESKSDLTSPPSVLHRSMRALQIKFRPGRRQVAS